MQCPKCRAAMPNGAKYCTECGAKLPVQPDSVPNVPQPAIQEAPAYEAQPVMTEAASAVQERPVKLKWFKFLIYFALWSGGILTALYSFAYFTGTVLGIGIDAELVYSYYPLLRVFHIFCGLENIAYGALPAGAVPQEWPGLSLRALYRAVCICTARSGRHKSDPRRMAGGI